MSSANPQNSAEFSHNHTAVNNRGKLSPSRHVTRIILVALAAAADDWSLDELCPWLDDPIATIHDAIEHGRLRDGR
jgi:hypothetical protein